MLFLGLCQRFLKHSSDFFGLKSALLHYCFVSVINFCVARRRYRKERSEKTSETAYVVATIFLCFLVTIGFAFAYSGKSFLKVAGVFANDEKRSFYAICIGGYEDITLARNTAEFSKERGGAGYVFKESDSGNDKIYIVLSVYDDKTLAENVLSTLGDKSAQIKEISVNVSDFSWASGERKDAVKKAMKSFDVAFDALENTGNSLENDEITLDGAKTKIKVLYEQIKDIKSVFYENVRGIDDDKITEIKLFLTTVLALLDNVSFASKVKATSSIRYELVQIVFCFKALCGVV